MLKQEGQEGKQSKLANTKSMALMVGASVAAAMLGEDGDAGDHDEELGDHHDDHDDYADADGEGDQADVLQAAQDAAPLVAATAVAGFSTARAARTVSNASDLLREPPPIAVGPLAMRAGKRSPRRVKTRLTRTPPPVPSTRSATPPRRAPPSGAVVQPPDPEPDPEPELEPGSRLAAQQEEECGDSGVSPPLAELGRAIIDQALAAAATGAPDGVESLPAGYARMAATLGYAGSQNGPLLVQLSV